MPARHQPADGLVIQRRVDPELCAPSLGPPQLPPRCVDRPAPPVLPGVGLMLSDGHRIGGSAIS
jgi:hypothetical protein